MIIVWLCYPNEDITELNIPAEATSHIRSATPGELLQIGIPNSDQQIAMIFIPGGSYRFSHTKGKNKKYYQTEITYPYWLGKYEITQEVWEKVTGRTFIPKQEKHRPIATGAQYPMCQISYYECLDFCDRLTELAQQQGNLPKGYCFSLPTEAQWELAYSCGEEIGPPWHLEERAWIDDGSPGTGAHPVGMKAPNAWGFHDMLGNIWELCSDFASFDRLHGRNPVNWKTDDKNLTLDDRLRIVMTGSGWNTSMLYMFHEVVNNANTGDFDIGFRVALVPEEQHRLLKKRLKNLKPTSENMRHVRRVVRNVGQFFKWLRAYILKQEGGAP